MVKHLLDRTTALWLVPIFFLLHNFEDGITMRATLEEVHSGMPRFLRVFLPPVTYEQFLITLVLLTAIALCCAWFGQLERDRSWGVYALVGLQMVLLINVFGHITTMIVLGHYTAGSATSLLVNLPFSLYLLRRAMREEWVGRRGFLLLIPTAVVVHTPVLFGFLFISRYLSRLLFGT